MSLKVSISRTIAYTITFLINGFFLSAFLPLPWPYYFWVLVASIFYISLGLLGIYGIIREKWTILCSYANVLIVVVIFKVTAIIILAVAIKHSMSMTEKVLQLLISGYDQGGFYREKMDYIQEAGQCCGIYGHWNYPYSLAPKSCCESTLNYINLNGTESFACKFYQNGCLLQFEYKFVMACIVLILVLAIKIILNVCAIFDGLYLVKKYRQLANKHVIMENPKELLKIEFI